MSKQRDKNWLTTTDAALVLGFTDKYLRERIAELKHGYHYRDVRKRGSPKANYRWHIKRLEDYFDIDPAERSP